jgi:hypothetical protein
MDVSPTTRIKSPTGLWKLHELEVEEGSTHRVDFDPHPGILVIPHAELNEEQLELWNTHFLSALPRDEHVAAHAAQLNGGQLIIVRKSEMRPLFLTHTLDGSSNWHTLIVVEPGASAKIVERFTGNGGRTSHITEAFTTISSLYLGEGSAPIDVGVAAKHAAAHSTSTLFTRGILGEQSKAIYEGTLSIGEHAAKSEAFQEADTLLLTPDADIKTSPMLYIDNNDVKCSHAATASRPDSEKLFYLQARGLSKEEAERLLIKAYAWPVIEAVPQYARQTIIPIVEPLIKTYAKEVEPDEG